uniref:Hydroxymethylbilane synthase n=1 Tax=Glossina palpalis gambiensis TaxID=67801 RepID=A0A1B0C6Y1_9MUSC
MRVYYEKPRTSLSWKGYIYDPNLNGLYNIELGLRNVRNLFLKLIKIQQPIAIEILNPLFSYYFNDLISWSSIGARTVSSQIHREIASNLSNPVGFKNSLDGNINNAFNAMLSAASTHKFLGINQNGKICTITSSGNIDSHIILRGAIMIDCNHSNSDKNDKNQIHVAESILRYLSDNHQLIIGLMLETTRTSPLAIWQANYVKKQLLCYYPYLSIKLLPIITSGDFNIRRIAAICKRDDPRDAIVSKFYTDIYSLPKKAIIGTSSVRRKFQLLALRPDLSVHPLRGNIHSRLNKLYQRDFHAIILAVAALKRLNINKKLYTPLTFSNMIPAMGQGAIMVQCRLKDSKILDLMHTINDKETEICINSERTIISHLATGCHIPIGVYAKIEQKNQIFIQTVVGSFNGSKVIRSEGKSDIKQAKTLSHKQYANFNYTTTSIWRKSRKNFTIVWKKSMASTINIFYTRQRFTSS